MLISEETLKAANNGILTDDQLKEALAHFSYLEKMLYLHGSIYQLVWSDVTRRLLNLRDMYYARRTNRPLDFDLNGKDSTTSMPF
jgi:hypothetical protein